MEKGVKILERIYVRFISSICVQTFSILKRFALKSVRGVDYTKREHLLIYCRKIIGLKSHDFCKNNYINIIKKSHAFVQSKKYNYSYLQIHDSPVIMVIDHI